MKSWLNEAREMAESDENIRVWLDVWENGIVLKIPIKKKYYKGKKEIIYEKVVIEPYSKFAERNLRKAIKLRKEGKVYIGERH